MDESKPTNQNIVLPYREARARVVDAFEYEYVANLLNGVDGNVSKAARMASMDRSYLIKVMKKHGLGRYGKIDPDRSYSSLEVTH